jgi:hypothetical protein
MLEDCVVDGIDDEWSSVLSAMRQRRDAARVTRQLVFDGA